MAVSDVSITWVEGRISDHSLMLAAFFVWIGSKESIAVISLSKHGLKIQLSEREVPAAD